jgi:hypothetical protein
MGQVVMRPPFWNFDLLKATFSRKKGIRYSHIRGYLGPPICFIMGHKKSFKGIGGP